MNRIVTHDRAWIERLCYVAVRRALFCRELRRDSKRYLKAKANMKRHGEEADFYCPFVAAFRAFVGALDRSRASQDNPDD